MKKQLLFLAVVACLSSLSVSVDASPPRDVGDQHESTIKQTLAVTPQEPFAITSNALEFTAIQITQTTSFTDAKPQPMVELVCPTSPIQSVDGLGVLSYSMVIHDHYKSPPILGFHYIDGRATEYRC